jgi:hypothetical protein
VGAFVPGAVGAVVADARPEAALELEDDGVPSTEACLVERAAVVGFGCLSVPSKAAAPAPAAMAAARTTKPSVASRRRRGVKTEGGGWLMCDQQLVLGAPS